MSDLTPEEIHAHIAVFSQWSTDYLVPALGVLLASGVDLEVVIKSSLQDSFDDPFASAFADVAIGVDTTLRGIRDGVEIVQASDDEDDDESEV